MTEITSSCPHQYFKENFTKMLLQFKKLKYLPGPFWDAEDIFLNFDLL